METTIKTVFIDEKSTERTYSRFEGVQQILDQLGGAASVVLGRKRSWQCPGTPSTDNWNDITTSQLKFNLVQLLNFKRVIGIMMLVEGWRCHLENKQFENNYEFTIYFVSEHVLKDHKYI